MPLYELFPPNIIQNVNEFAISTWTQFDSKTNFPFIPAKRPYEPINDNAIYFIGLLEDVSLLTQASERLIREAIQAPARQKRNHPWSPPNWTDVDKKLLKEVHLGHKYAQMKTTKTGKTRKGNADIRLAFSYNDMYAVKAHFTFGLRRPTADESHILTTTSSPILYYVPKTHARIKAQYYFKEGVFAPHHQSDFECFVLEANSTYIIPPHTIYLTLTIQQTLFSLIRCTTKVLKDLQEKPSPQFAALRIRQPRLYVPQQSVPAPRVWYPDVLLETPYQVPHEEDWTLGSILPTHIDPVSSTSPHPRVITEHLPQSSFTGDLVQEQVNRLINEQLQNSSLM